MVAVVERGGFLWFYDFFVGFVAFVFFLVPEACSMVVHRWLTDGGTWGF